MAGSAQMFSVMKRGSEFAGPSLIEGGTRESRKRSIQEDSGEL